jgi:hypothetical protein
MRCGPLRALLLVRLIVVANNVIAALGENLLRL